jgi:hypothetical protein
MVATAEHSPWRYAPAGFGYYQACEGRWCCRVWGDGDYGNLDVDEEEEEEEEDDEDDQELMQLTEESGI